MKGLVIWGFRGELSLLKMWGVNSGGGLGLGGKICNVCVVGWGYSGWGLGV